MQETSENKRKRAKTDAVGKTVAEKKYPGDRKTTNGSKTNASKSVAASDAQPKSTTRRQKASSATRADKSAKAARLAKTNATKATADRARQNARRTSTRSHEKDSHAYDMFIAAVLIVLSAIIFLMIFTFSAKDLLPDAEASLNIFGHVGAWIGNIMLKLFGLTSFCFPAICLFKGLTTFLGKPLDVKPTELVGLTLLLIAGSPLMEVCLHGQSVLDHAPGGALGTALFELAQHYLSTTTIGLVGAGVALIAVLLVTDTSIRAFIVGIFKLIRGLFKLIWRAIATPLQKLHEYRIARANRIPELPKDVFDPLTDPEFEESNDDLLGEEDDDEDAEDETASFVSSESALSTERPATSSETAAAVSDSAASASAISAPDAFENDDKMREDIVSKLDSEELEFAEDLPKVEDDPVEEDPLQAIANLNTKRKAPKPRSTRHADKVPTLEPAFDLSSILPPEALANDHATADAPVETSVPEVAQKALGSWKPRSLRKTEPSVVMTPPKSFAPETSMETIAVTPEPTMRPIRNVTNDILKQCDEPMPSMPVSGEQDAAPNASPNTAVTAQHPAAVPSAASAPVEEDFSAFFKKSGPKPTSDSVQNEKVALLNGISDIKPSIQSKARDIMSSPKPTVLQQTPPERPTRPFDLNELLPNEKPTHAFELTPNASNATTKIPNPSPVKAQPAKAQDSTRIVPDVLQAVVSQQAVSARELLDEKFDSLTEMPSISTKSNAKQPSIQDMMGDLFGDEADDHEDACDASAPVAANDGRRPFEPAPRRERTHSASFVSTRPGLLAKPAAAPTPALNASNHNFVADSDYRKVSEASIEKADRERLSHEDKRAMYQKPPLSLLSYDATTHKGYAQEELEAIATRIEDKLAEFNILGEIVHTCQGPVVTRFEFKPNPGTKVSKIPDLSNDLMMALEIVSIRILAPIPGKPVVGIEIPNEHRNTIYLKEVLASEAFLHNKSPLTVALGQDTEGHTVVSNLAKMPHLLVAGTTGSGKSVSINTMICSILYNATPEDVRLILVDPKCLEFTIYAGIPHLLTPPITTPKETQAALDWACEEMERRYRLLSDLGVRNIVNYNEVLVNPSSQRVVDELAIHDENGDAKHKHLPYIVIIVDEFADLMMVARKEIETQIARLAQKARAAGIHIILATQRPSTNVITGIIKANFPSRLALKVGAIVDSRTILDHMGAEKLLGRGDGLFRGPDSDTDQRVHGCFVSDDEVQSIVDFLCAQGEPEYNDDVLASAQEPDVSEDDLSSLNPRNAISDDPVYQQALELVRVTRKVSTSHLQRELGIGYPKASKIIMQMEKNGVIGPADSKHNREIFI